MPSLCLNKSSKDLGRKVVVVVVVVVGIVRNRNKLNLVVGSADVLIVEVVVVVETAIEASVDPPS